jgi:hypothetical protein
VSPQNDPVVWATAVPQRDEPGALNVHARICGSSREKSLQRPGPRRPQGRDPRMLRNTFDCKPFESISVGNSRSAQASVHIRFELPLNPNVWIHEPNRRTTVLTCEQYEPLLLFGIEHRK